MASDMSTFEWHIGEEGWNARPSTALATVRLNQAALLTNEWRIVSGAARSMLLCLLALVIGGSASLSQQESTFRTYQAGILQTIAVEERAWRANDRRLLETTIAPQASELWAPSWRKYWRGNVSIQEQFALELIHIRKPRITPEDSYLFVDLIDRRMPPDWWLISPTRETRVYIKFDTGKSDARESNTGQSDTAQSSTEWIRTVPPVSYWGTEKSLDTPNIRYEFLERDSELVQALAPRLDSHYDTLFNMLELAPLDDDRKFTVRIAPHPRRGRGPRSTVIYLTSPLLATKPAGLSDEGYVERYVVEQLVAFAVNRAANSRGGSGNLHWSTVIWALRSQLEEQLTGYPSPWFLQSEAIFESYGRERFPLSLEELTRIRKPKTDPDRRHIYWQQVGAELVVGYALHTYGTEVMPELIQALSKSRKWEQLIPAVFGISAQEFERDFNQYIGERYSWDSG